MTAMPGNRVKSANEPKGSWIDNDDVKTLCLSDLTCRQRDR